MTNEEIKKRFRLNHLKHMGWVIWESLKISSVIMKRAFTHDLSKFSEVESLGFGKMFTKLRSTTFGEGSYDFIKRSELLKPALEHHYERNSHHPEHYENGIQGMDLYDIVEMWCDWNASVRKHVDGDIKKSIKYNKERFNVSDDLVSIFENTVKD